MKALYAGSFDPLTKGHIDIINRAVEAFGKVHVLIADNPAKKYTFSADKRESFITARFNTAYVTVGVMKRGLVADYAYENRYNVLVKGVRDSKDFEYEANLHEINTSQQRGLDTHILIARADLRHVSSSAAKEICRLHGLVHEYVDLRVKHALESTINEQELLGITGGIGSGKSHFGKLMAKHTTHAPCHNIELDEIAHDILFKREEPVYNTLRYQIQAALGVQFWGRKEIGDIVFNDADKLSTLNQLMREPLLTRLRLEMGSRKGIIFINAALLAEFDLLWLCNNRTFVVHTPLEIRRQRMEQRGMTPEQIERRLNSQFTHNQKLARINEIIARDGYGQVTVVDGSAEPEWSLRRQYLLGMRV